VLSNQNNMTQTIDLCNASVEDMAKHFSDLTRQTIKSILMQNKMQGRLEHGSYRFWLSEFISLPYKSALDKPYLCSYLRKLTYEVEGSCYPIEQTDWKLDERINEVSHFIYNKHKEFLKKLS
jgi:hypothetical protein